MCESSLAMENAKGVAIGKGIRERGQAVILAPTPSFNSRLTPEHRGEKVSKPVTSGK